LTACEQIDVQLSDYVDGHLGRWSTWWVRRHLARCPQCAAACEDVRRLSVALRTWRDLPESVHLRARVLSGARLREDGAEPVTAWGAGRPALRRRTLVVSMPVAAAIAVLVFIALNQQPARALQATLARMARAQSAHARGHYVVFRSRDLDGKLVAEQLTAEYWYRAPDRYRREMRSRSPNSSIGASDLIIRGGQAEIVSQSPRGPRQAIPADASRIREQLSAFGFFSDDTLLARAARQPGARVQSASGELGGRPVPTLTVEQQTPTRRLHWRLFVDPVTRLILRAEMTEESREGSAWQLRTAATLSDFQYDVAVPDRFFEVPSAEPY
jgi:hypothetical protein